MKILINDAVYIKKGFKLSAEKSLLDLDFIYRFLTEESYWGKGYPEINLKYL